MTGQLDVEKTGRQALGPRAQRVLRRQVMEDERADVPVGRRAGRLAEAELEVELAQVVPTREISQSPSREQRSQRCIDGGAQPGDERRHVDGPGVPAEGVAHV